MLLYLPIVLPPLVVGVSLLVFFRTGAGQFIETHMLSFTFAVPGIIASRYFTSRIQRFAEIIERDIDRVRCSYLHAKAATMRARDETPSDE